MPGQVTEKSKFAAKQEAARLFGDLNGLADRLAANELDPAPAKKAAKALVDFVTEVQKVKDAEAARADAQAVAHGVSGGDLDYLRRENEELKRQLATKG